ncbi:bifunctional alpha/beta hydrolase/OsmC family protein [Aliidiomarina quisquiliarum]|uniref:bifunctional alpha/beta hydrolase/OsmC family protein n=1 Tax=Aliidiomarina quisquiliarum TaxID=2938947 RepID=UPI00208F3705|nr:bifunctional alpha/beta hydrolase/OsmC family protein [Aliidiomarina quisquiliarum]MCO4320720.1 bifunctional alpha/beta hydrolase/OsmC family protein [Aliidiomarina quisquiliarum]
MREKVEFVSNGLRLAGLLESPTKNVKAYAVFAHCFTCGKDIAAASRISRALVKKGIAVLRFDFTGLGNSDGDFSNTNFTSNLDDLRAAAAHLTEHYFAPQLLIGHSLGGAAVLAVANSIESVKAVVSIAAPSKAEHVIHNFADHLDEIKRDGVATVKLGPREFEIQKQLIDDLSENSQHDFVLKGKSLLVLHSPMDTVVAINQAEKIYNSVKHPKSFISLDKADHFLTNKSDAEYAAAVISSWADKYIEYSSEHVKRAPLAPSGSVVVSEKDHNFTLNVVSDSHYWLADEPEAVGGQNLGPDPYDHLLASLGACTVMTLRMYAKHKKIHIDDISVTLSHSKNYHEDCKNCIETDGRVELISRKIKIVGDITEQERERFLAIADKCPVHRTLHSKLVIETVAEK